MNLDPLKALGPKLLRLGRTEGLFVAALALAAALRLKGIAWGFPLQRAYVDEYVTVFYSMNLFNSGPHPHFFDYPSLFLYALWGTVAVLGKIIPLADGFTWAGFLEARSVLPLLAGRGLSLAAALVTVILTAEAAWRWRNGREGTWAAFLLALCPLHVRMSHYAMPDVFCAMLTAAGALLWILFLKEDKPRLCPASGFFFGLAAAAKYTPALLAVGLAFWLIAFKRDGRRALFFSGAALAGFLTGFPYALLAWNELLPRFLTLFNNLIKDDAGGGAISFALNHYASNFNSGEEILSAAFLLLAPLLFLRGDAAGKSLSLAAVFYFLVVGFWRTQNIRYYMPLLPLACLSAAMLIETPSLFFPRRGAGFQKKTRPVLLVLGAFVCLGFLIFSGRFLAALNQVDTRLRALADIRRTVPPGASILRFPHTPEFSPKDPYAVKVDWEGRWKNESPTVLLRQVDYAVTSHFEATPDAWEKEWEENAREVLSVSEPSPSFPHHPRVRVWTKK